MASFALVIVVDDAAWLPFAPAISRAIFAFLLYLWPLLGTLNSERLWTPLHSKVVSGKISHFQPYERIGDLDHGVRLKIFDLACAFPRADEELAKPVIAEFHGAKTT